MNKFEIMMGGKVMSFETGRLAKLADAAVLVTYGQTMVLVSVCASKKAKEGTDFFPLTVDYSEKSYAGGKIPGGYFKREGKATEKETLTSRLMDRPLRPLFPEGFYNDVQVTATLISHDKENGGDILAINAASAAVMLSGLPFLGPMAAARVGQIKGELILNPTIAQMQESDLDIVVAITDLGIIMIEAGAQIVSEERIVEALAFAQEQLKPWLELQKKMKEQCGKAPWQVTLATADADLFTKVKSLSAADIDRINKTEKSKESREKAMGEVLSRICKELVVEGSGLTDAKIGQIFHDVEKKEVREFILSNKMRTDGRRFDEIRTITAETGLLPRAHGSALFTRGQTQSLGVATLGTEKDEQTIDAVEGDITKSFMLHYNFPAFSVGEVKANRGPGRREIGHGALAERGLRAVIPAKQDFPYTIRLVSDILESNGSSSMASVCSGTLALMDAGVPIKAPVSGIAMGLIKEKDRYAILSDIAGIEDHLGDMDFKVTGTKEGVTALQLDLKLKDSISVDVLKQALEQAKQGRLFIMDKMVSVLSSPKQELSAYAPRITRIKIDPEKIRDVIGSGGKTIRKITADTGVAIDIQDDGTVSVASSDQAAAKKALDIIQGITAEAEVGKIYTATVKRIMNFGAFCEFLPGKEGLVHISELDDKRVATVDEVVKVGDEIRVKVIEIDMQGRVNLSKKQSKDNSEPVVSSRRSEANKGFSSKRA